MLKGKGGKKLYTSREARKELGICEKTMYVWINRGILKPLRQGGIKKTGRLLFPEDQINKLLGR